MAVSNSDIIVYASLNCPENDTDTSGGAIDTTTKIIYADISTTDALTVISSNSGDTTQTVTVTGRNAAGTITTEDFNLNGTTRVTGATDFERILKVEVDAAHAGTITISRDNSPTYTAIGTMETGILALRRLFYDAQSDASGGSTKVFYEKIFIKNTNGTNSVTNAKVIELSDPSTFTKFDIETYKGDSNSVADRLTAPTSNLSTFAHTVKSIAGTVLAPAEYIGVWLEMTLIAGETPAKNVYQLQLTGSST